MIYWAASLCLLLVSRNEPRCSGSDCEFIKIIKPVLVLSWMAMLGQCAEWWVIAVGAPREPCTHPDSRADCKTRVCLCYGIWLMGSWLGSFGSNIYIYLFRYTHIHTFKWPNVSSCVSSRTPRNVPLQWCRCCSRNFIRYFTCVFVCAHSCSTRKHTQTHHDAS